MPFSIFRLRTRRRRERRGPILGTAIFAMFLMLTLYMQQVLGYSAMKTGVAYLAVAGTAIFWSARRGAARDPRRREAGARRSGMAFLAAGLLCFTQVSLGGSYVADLLPGFLLIAVGMGFSFVPISIAALAGVQPAEAGLASGLINTSQQIGGALGIAALSAVATSATSNSVATGPARPVALTDGFQAAFFGAAAVATRRRPGRAVRRPRQGSRRRRRGRDRSSAGARGGVGTRGEAGSPASPRSLARSRRRRRRRRSGSTSPASRWSPWR